MHDSHSRLKRTGLGSRASRCRALSPVGTADRARKIGTRTVSNDLSVLCPTKSASGLSALTHLTVSLTHRTSAAPPLARGTGRGQYTQRTIPKGEDRARCAVQAISALSQRIIPTIHSTATHQSTTKLLPCLSLAAPLARTRPRACARSRVPLAELPPPVLFGGPGADWAAALTPAAEPKAATAIDALPAAAAADEAERRARGWAGARVWAVAALAEERRANEGSRLRRPRPDTRLGPGACAAVAEAPPPLLVGVEATLATVASVLGERAVNRAIRLVPDVSGEAGKPAAAEREGVRGGVVERAADRICARVCGRICGRTCVEVVGDAAEGCAARVPPPRRPDRLLARVRAGLLVLVRDDDRWLLPVEFCERSEVRLRRAAMALNGEANALPPPSD